MASCSALVGGRGILMCLNIGLIQLAASRALLSMIVVQFAIQLSMPKVEVKQYDQCSIVQIFKMTMD